MTEPPGVPIFWPHGHTLQDVVKVADATLLGLARVKQAIDAGDASRFLLGNPIKPVFIRKEAA